jgi:hypothetical protein
LPSDLGGSFLFIGLSYIVGQVLVQGTGSRFEDYLNRKDKGRLSERLLLMPSPWIYGRVCAICRSSQVGPLEGVRPSFPCKSAIRLLTSPSAMPR